MTLRDPFRRNEPIWSADIAEFLGAVLESLPIDINPNRLLVTSSFGHHLQTRAETIGSKPTDSLFSGLNSNSPKLIGALAESRDHEQPFEVVESHATTIVAHRDLTGFT